jgi:hypothetical protein
MAKCNYCDKEFDSEQNQDSSWQSYEHSMYCSDWCRKQSHDAYDRYVDPLGFYRAKAVDPYE